MVTDYDPTNQLSQHGHIPENPDVQNKIKRVQGDTH